MKEYFFNTVRMYMVPTSDFNQYNDVLLYWSYDQEKFLKRKSTNTRDLENRNWVVIPHNVYMLRSLKQRLQSKSKDDITARGRLIEGEYVKDDLWKEFVDFVDSTFDNFYDNVLIKPELQTTKINKQHGKQLF